MVLHCLSICTQNPRLRNVVLKLDANRGSDKISMKKQEASKRKLVLWYSLDSHMDPST